MADDTGSFDFGSFIRQYMGGPGGNQGNMASFIPAFAQAYQQYNNAGQYRDLGQQAADVANPFGDRSYYRDRLRTSYDDPSAILNDPGHKIQVQRGLDTVSAQNAAKGYLGSGNMLVDLSKYASDSDATYLDQERSRLANLAGAQFDPANAGRFIMQGGEQEIASKNKALDAMFTGLNMNPSQSDRGTGGGGGRSPLDVINSLSNPQDIARQISSMASMAGSSAQTIWNYLMQNPNVSPATKQILDSIGHNPGTYGSDLGATPDSTWNVTSGGYTDTPGPGYDEYLRTGQWPDVGGNIDFDNLDWNNVDFSQWSPSDWGDFEQYFGVFGE